MTTLIATSSSRPAASLSGDFGRGSIWAAAGIAALWFAGVLLIALGDGFALRAGAAPVAMLAAIVAPPLVFAVVLTLSPRLRGKVLSLDPALLTALQGWRVLGGGFLFLYAFGHLPGLFAWPAGVGDVAVGLAAPFAAVALARGQISVTSGRLAWVHVAGLLDFVVAVATGIVARAPIGGLVEGVTSAPMGVLPLVLVPAFAVPAFIILHLIVLAQAWRANR